MTQKQRLLNVLLDRAWHTTEELEARTGIWYPPRRIFDLMRDGHDIEKEWSRLPNGAEQRRYRLVKTAKQKGQSIVEELAAMKSEGANKTVTVPTNQLKLV